jgi:nucleotide-binding universal stress UspA family protein
VGVDGSEDSRTALAWAAAQAEGRDVEIVALCTWRAPILPSDAIGQPALLMNWDAFETELARRVDEIIESVRHDTQSIAASIEPRIEQGRAAHLLIEASRDAELLVVGSQGRGGLSGVVLGSVSRQCATHATVPVVVVPRDVACTPASHVLVGFDGSRNARAAVKWALEFSNADAEIVVVRSVELAPWMDEAGVRDRFPVEVDKAFAEFESELAELDFDRARSDEVDPATRITAPQNHSRKEALCSIESSFRPTGPTTRGGLSASVKRSHGNATRSSSCSRSSRTRPMWSGPSN